MEVLSLQVGGYANFVGSHFWNFQDELLSYQEKSSSTSTDLDVNPDILYRNGETHEGVPTYNPRLIAFDLKGSLGAVQPRGSLYGQPCDASSEPIATWANGAQICRAESARKNLFLQRLDQEEEEEEEMEVEEEGKRKAEAGSAQQRSRGRDLSAAATSSMGRSGMGGGGSSSQSQTFGEIEDRIVEELESGVKFWTDYLKTHLHPGTVHEVEGAWRGLAADDCFGDGRDWLRSDVEREAAADRIRRFVEECDHLQGFQCVVDVSGGFSSLAARLLREVVADEYARIPRLLFAVKPPAKSALTLGSGAELASDRARLEHALHDVASFGALAPHVSCFIPAWRPSLGQLFPHLTVNDASLFHTSSIFACALDTFTLPFRTCRARESMGTLTQRLCPMPQVPASALFAAFPAPGIIAAVSGAQGPGGHVLEHGMAPLWSSLAPLSPLSPPRPLLLRTTGSGMPTAEALSLRRPLVAGSEESASLASASDWLEASLSMEHQGPSIRQVSVTPQPIVIPLSFPRLFGPAVRRRGGLLPGTQVQQNRLGGGVKTLPALTRLSTSQAVLPYLSHLTEELERCRGSKSSTLLSEWDMDVPELKESMYEFVRSYGGPDGV